MCLRLSLKRYDLLIGTAEMGYIRDPPYVGALMDGVVASQQTN